MEYLTVALVLKPFVALAILVPARVLETVLQRRMRDGWLKRLLFSPLPGHGRSRD
jgi:hypothetical protein